MESKIAVAFAAGLLSFVTPCVLPLVPGYLAAVSGTQPGVGTARRDRELPFIAASPWFVALGALAGRGRWRSPTIATSSSRSQASSSWRSASRSWGCSIPFFERMAAPGLLGCAQARLERAARRSVRSLRGAVHLSSARVDPRPRERVEYRRPGSLLLLVYSRASPSPSFSSGSGSTVRRPHFRWLRDRTRCSGS